MNKKFIRMYILYTPANSDFTLCWDMIESLSDDDDIDHVLLYARQLVEEYFTDCEIVASLYQIEEFKKKGG
jgi:hypothetical protein